MTIDEFISKYNGKVVADGQCGNLVRAYWNEVDKTNPPSYENSKDYWFNPVPGYDKVSSPQQGNIAIYNGHGAFPEGHSAIYYDGRVFEQNADPDGSPAHLFNRSNTYLLGYLRKQGGSMDNPDGDDIALFYQSIRGDQPTKEELDFAASQNWKSWNKSMCTAIKDLRYKTENLEKEKVALYSFQNNIAAALGLPLGSTADECVKAIEKLKMGGVTSVVVNGKPYVEA